MKIKLSENVTPLKLRHAAKENVDKLKSAVAVAAQLGMTNAAENGLTQVTLTAVDLGIDGVASADQYDLVEPTWIALKDACFFAVLNSTGSSPRLFVSLVVKWYP